MDQDDDRDEIAEIIGQCQDGMPLVRPATRCQITKRLIPGPMLLSSEKGATVVGYNLSIQALDQLVLGVDHLVPRLTAMKRYSSGDIVDFQIGSSVGRCLHLDLQALQTVPERIKTKTKLAIEARKGLKETFRHRYNIERTVQLKMLCQEKFEIVSGNYLSWWDDETLLAEYYGETKDEKPHGFGYKVWASGAWYVGEWVAGTEQTVKYAKSRFVWPDGTEYIGTFNKGKRHGEGVKLWQDGTKYEGQFAMGLEHGMGKKTFADTAVFEGRFRFGVRDGPGVLTLSDGSRERGTFKDPALDSSEAGFDVPVSKPVREYDVPDLLSLATMKIAHVVATSPNLYSASLLQRLLPNAQKTTIAQTFVENAKGLSDGFRRVVPSIAWKSPKHLALSGLRLNEQDLLMLIYFLETNHELEVLSVQSCNLDATSVALFEPIILSSQTLSTVDFSWNKVGKEGAQAFARVLNAGNHKITTVRLMGCSLGAVGCEYLSHMLRSNQSITSLHLSFNDIGPLGASCLAEVIPINGTLTQLDIRSNRIGPSGGLALADAMLHSKGNMKVLQVCDNGLGDDATARLAACLRGTTSFGLKSFSAASLKGPKCVSGTLQKRSDRRNLPKASALRGELEEQHVYAKPPKAPGVRLLSDHL